MAKINKIYKIDVSLIPVFLGLAVTGVGLHISSERFSHAIWHSWAVANVIVCLPFLILAFLHIKQHRGLYKTLVKGNTKGKGVTIVLSTLFLLETISGIILLAFVEGANSWWGHFHWVFGLLLSAFGIGHFAKRFPRLKKGLSINQHLKTRQN